MGVVRVAVAGATGRTGSEAARAIAAAADLQLVGAVARRRVGEDLGAVLGEPAWGIAIGATVEEVLVQHRPDVLVDFTLADCAGGHAIAALRMGVRPVVGATGIPAEQMDAIRMLCEETGLGAAVIPNFSFGILLLQRFCREAVRFFPDVHLVEMHHQGKRDKPSGTALQLRRTLESSGARNPVEISSVRLPGLVAHHNLVFGAPGETLTFRHDTLNRSSFGPGVVLAVRQIAGRVGFVDDLEALLPA